MNIPEVYLVEPYNAYAPKGRKKHWHEVIEEQAMLARILAEQQALREAQSKTLPPNTPDISSPTVGNMNAGAGGTPAWDFWNPTGDVVNFDRTPSSGDAPVTVTFTNLTTTPQFDSYRWFFSDGQTSTDVNPVMIFQSGSEDPIVITASLQATNSISGVPGGKSPDVYISVAVPTVTAGFTVTIQSDVNAPVSVSFINTTTNTSQTPSTTYLWEFGSASMLPYTGANPPPQTYTTASSYTASLQATGSYGIASRYTQSWVWVYDPANGNLVFI